MALGIDGTKGKVELYKAQKCLNIIFWGTESITQQKEIDVNNTLIVGKYIYLFNILLSEREKPCAKWSKSMLRTHLSTITIEAINEKSIYPAYLKFH
jgi:hypothetical protein